MSWSGYEPDQYHEAQGMRMYCVEIISLHNIAALSLKNNARLVGYFREAGAVIITIQKINSNICQENRLSSI